MSLDDIDSLSDSDGEEWGDPALAWQDQIVLEGWNDAEDWF